MSLALPRHILVPHDFSDTAQHALAYAIELASKLGARITIVHAYEVPSYGYPDGLAINTDVAGSIRGAAAAALEGVAAGARRPGLEVQTLLREGTPWREIIGASTDAHVDLIVVGTHGRHGLARALLGRVAEKIVRTSPCPVLTVHGPAPAA